MVLNAAVQMLREAEELKQKILKFKNGTSMLQERSLWAIQQQLQKVYGKLLVLDLEYALERKVEQDLWSLGFKQQIEALQAISKDRKNPMRSEGQAMLSWVLQSASGFYLCLLHQICTAFKLDLPFRRRASLLGWVSGWPCARPQVPPPAAARYVCQHCLVHLGDLARYRHQLRVAHSFYRHALVVSAVSGQPYNQLALVSWRRGRRLGALYWHVRSLLVRAPFPPAQANLARTLRAAASGRDGPQPQPVLPGMTSSPPPLAVTSSRPLDAHAYVTELIRALHLLHTLEDLDTAATLVDSLNSSLTALVATDNFESMTLIKMAVVIMWLVHGLTDDLRSGPAALCGAEATAAALAQALAAGAVLALLLPAYTADEPPERALPALKVWLQWLTGVGSAAVGAWAARPQLWAALAHTLNKLAPLAASLPDDNKYETVPLPEDEELHGFLPLEEALKPLRFAEHATWDSYDGRVPDMDPSEDNDTPREVSATCLSNEPGLAQRVRAHRLLRLGTALAETHPNHLTVIETGSTVEFTATAVGGEQLSAALALLAVTSRDGGPASASPPPDDEADSDDDVRPPPPLIISEADFREKVIDKRVGILKPQGSLERAREERAAANSDELEAENSEDSSKLDEKREARKNRVNIAMAAIMRKQEENKQVKFVSPPPTPLEPQPPSPSPPPAASLTPAGPKVIKSLAKLPVGRKTGGILSLKDKSAGYPHLQNIEESPKKEEDKKKDSPPNKTVGPTQSSQTYQPKQNWTPAQNYDPRMNFQKFQSPVNYGPGFQPVNNQGIRLPVVNPKEIDVRTAALQKQNSRPELFQDGQKHNYQMSGDKKNFLNDLPPRFANQYRYWQTAQENQFNDNKFRDDSFKNNSLFNNQQQRPNSAWNSQMPEYQPPNPWWKPDNPPPNFNANFTPPLNMPNFYSPQQLSSNIPNPYQNMPSYNQMPNKIGPEKQNLITPPTYLQTAIGQPMQTVQNLVSNSNYNSMNNFGSYAPPVGYDSSMYPQFGNKVGYQPMQMKMLDKPQMYQSSSGTKEMEMFGQPLDMPRGGAFGGALGADQGLEQGTRGTEEVAGSTYSLFSGAPDTNTWGNAQRLQQQSLWSGPGPSPLERLLEQQKQIKPPQ